MQNSLFSDNIPAGIPLSVYTTAISETVNGARHLAGVWVIAELSDVRESGGHCYMELIEKNEAGQTIAKLRANIWRSTYFQLRQKFYNATQKNISTGIKALVKGSVNHHSLYGLAFNITDIDPSYTLGDLERIRREIIMKLQREGIANLNKELKMPVAPQKIAVISAEGAAGYGDFINQLINNVDGFVFYPSLFPCSMQGDKVSESIRKALSLIEATADVWDCVVIVRGGGATTDLNGFDDYELAKAVATCGLPVVVGIGHERDRNVLDEIAHTSLKTPTAVAAFFVDSARRAYDAVINLAEGIRTYSSQLIRGEERRLSTIQGQIPQLALRRIVDSNGKIDYLLSKIPLLLSGRFGKEKVKLDNFDTILPNILGNKITHENLKIEKIKDLIANLWSPRVSQSKQLISNLESMIQVLNPINTIKRGYSITRINGKAVKRKTDLTKGDILTTVFSDGEIKSQVLN